MKHIPLRAYWELLSHYIRPLWRKALLLAFLILAGIGLQVANPQVIRYFLDTALAQGDNTNLIYAALIFLGASVLLQIVTVASTYVGEDVGWTSTNRLRADLALHCLRLDMGFHKNRTPGEMIERIDGDVANLAIFFSQFVVRVVGSLLLLIGVLIALAVEDWRLCLAMTIYAIVALAVLIRMREIAVPHWTAAREASAELFGFLEERLNGTEDIRSSGAREYVLRDLFRFNRERLQKERRAGTASTFMVMTWLGLYTIGQVIAFTVGYFLFRDGLLTLGTVYLIVYYTDAIYRPIEQLTDQIQNLQKAGASIERVNELYNTTPKVVDGVGEPLPDGALGVQFRQVSFAYDDEPPPERLVKSNGAPVTVEKLDRAPLDIEAVQAAPNGVPHTGNGVEVTIDNAPELVLKAIELQLQPGQILGLLGRTGSGKTTITRLLFRLYDPIDGAIRLGHDDRWVELRDTRLDDLRARVGIVTQDVQLFRASVRDNLTFFDPAISDDRIMAALDELDLGDWCRNLPQGLDTELAAGGGGLSAGEAQLLAFTRVFLKNPGLVILDEASSRLDPATEARIEHAIDRLLAGRTAIIVAHRLATVHRADQIMILEDGSVLEHGAYRDLVRNSDSRFARLLRTGQMEEVLA